MVSSAGYGQVRNSRVPYFCPTILPFIAMRLHYYGILLLLTNRSRQVATLRVLAGLFALSPSVYQEFLTSKADDVVLYCLHRTPGVTSTETLQVFFDDFVVGGVREKDANVSHIKPPLSGLSSMQKRSDCIRDVHMLKLLICIIIASPSKPQLSRAVMDWLREICDDQPENAAIVLESIGLIPFLIILSLWTIGGSGTLACMVGPAASDSRTDIVENSSHIDTLKIPFRKAYSKRRNDTASSSSADSNHIELIRTQVSCNAVKIYSY